jgi:hypothetical protein
MSRLLGLAGLVLIVAAGCAPQTVTRRSAFVPTPAPPDFTGATVPQGKGEISASANPLYIGIATRLFPQVGDAGLYVPHTQYQLAIRFGLAQWFDVGILAQWAPWASKDVSAVGVPPLPSEGHLFAVGVAFRAGAHLGGATRPIRLGASLELLGRSVPYSIWQCPSCRNDYSFQPALYELKDQGRESFVDYTFAVAASWDLGAVSPFVSLSIASTIRNVGFDATLSLKSTLEPGAPMVIGTAGLEARLGRFRLRGFLFVPFNRDGVDYSPVGVGLSAGFLL